MDEALLMAYLQQHGPFAQWIAGYPLLGFSGGQFTYYTQ